MRIVGGLVLVAVALIGCYLPMHGMRDSFSEGLRNTIGRTLDQLKYERGREFIGTREPTEVKPLANGNRLYVYENYWAQVGIEREPCTVFLELQPPTMTAVNATAEGEGCYKAY